MLGLSLSHLLTQLLTFEPDSVIRLFWHVEIEIVTGTEKRFTQIYFLSFDVSYFKLIYIYTHIPSRFFERQNHGWRNTTLGNTATIYKCLNLDICRPKSSKSSKCVNSNAESFNKQRA